MSSAKPTATIANGITQVTMLNRRLVASKPTDMPRKQAKRTMLVKKVRNSTALPNQRMQASSRKRLRS